MENQQEVAQQAQNRYAELERKLVLPDTVCNITGHSIMQLRGAMIQFLENNAQDVYGEGGKVIGQTIPPYAKDIQQMYVSFVNVFWSQMEEQGVLVEHEDYVKHMQKLAMEAREEEAPSLVDAQGNNISSEE